jgi:polyferredoxin
MRTELTRFPFFKALLKNRWLQLLVFLLMLAGFLFAILSGFAGTPVGSSNFGIVFVWIAWWAILILVAVPFFGRAWCAICPIPMPGEWLQRGAILEPPRKKPHWFNLRWPNKLRNIWLQNLTFTLVALFSSVILTTPRVTAIVLAAMLFLAIGMSIIFERRTFCRYICPVGGFIGLYAQAAPLELRVFPGGLTKNTYCGLCMECLRTCPYDNISVNARPFSADLAKPSKRMDEAFKAFIMLGAAMIYAGVLLGPWGALKSAAYSVGTMAWFGYAVAFLVFIFGLLPALLWWAVKLGHKHSKNNVPTRHSFSAFATALVPLGLMFWVAFSLSFVLTNAAYILSSLSDPLGWGWNLFGTAGITWQPYLTAILLPTQTLILVGGFLWSARIAQKVGLELKASAIPVIVFFTMVTLTMLGLLL